MVLDNPSLVLSEVELPSCMDTSDEVEASYIVVHGDFGPHIVKVYLGEIEVYGRVHGSGEWVLERGVCRLSEATRGLSGFPAEKQLDWALAQVCSDGTRLLVVAVWDPNIHIMERRWWFFSVDVETMEMKVVPESAFYEAKISWSYALPWPSFIRVLVPGFESVSILNL
jgi:hypothetical protein